MLNVVRLVGDVLDVFIVIVGRIDVNFVALVILDIDSYDRFFLIGERILEGFFRVRVGLD